MTDATRRLSLFAGAILVLFLSWAFIAARPWAAHSASAPDPRVQALTAREQRLRHDAVLVRRLVNGRWRHYRIALHHRQVAIARATTRHQHLSRRLRSHGARRRRQPRVCRHPATRARRPGPRFAS